MLDRDLRHKLYHEDPSNERKITHVGCLFCGIKVELDWSKPVEFPVICDSEKCKKR